MGMKRSRSVSGPAQSGQALSEIVNRKYRRPAQRWRSGSWVSGGAARLNPTGLTTLTSTDNSMTIGEIVGFIAASLTTVSFVPQVMKLRH